MPTVTFAIDSVPARGREEAAAAAADAADAAERSQDTDVTEGVLSDSFASVALSEIDDNKSDKSTASVSTAVPRHSETTQVRRNIDASRHSTRSSRAGGGGRRSRQGGRRRRRGSSTSTGASFFQDISHSLYNTVVGPVVDSLRDEAQEYDDASSVSSSSFARDDMDATWYEHVPYLDDTMVTYNTRTKMGGKRKWCGAIVNHPVTQSCILCMITLNALCMGLMTFDFVLDNPDVMWYLILADWIFLALFVVEVILQLIWHGRAALGDPWLMFDVGILFCSWVPELRIFRFARVINRLEILQNLTRAIGLVMPRMFSIALFLLIVIYTYAVLFTELFRHVQFEGGVNYFETLPASMFTCFEMMTLEWAHIARELEGEAYAWLPITTFVVICGVIFFNLVLAVICDAVAVLGVDWSGRNEEEKRTLKELQEQIVDVQHRIHRLKELFTQLIKNQKNTLHLLEVQLAKQLNNVETLSNLHNDKDGRRSSKRNLHTRQDVLSKLTQDYKFREHKFLTKIRIVSGLILESDFFEFFIFCVICTDCVLMGVATFDAVNESPKWIGILDTISFVFLIIYTTEAAMGFIYLGRGVFSDAWMAFDIFIVVTSWIADLLQGLKTFREFRAIRIVRAFRLITILHPLRDLVVAIGTAIPRVSKIMPLLALIFYIFAVLFVELFRDVQFDDGVDYFGRLDLALFTCLQMMTMEWAELSREALEKTGLWWANFLFVLFVCVSGMLFFDLIKATVCDAVAVINGRSRRLADIKKCRKRLKRMSKTVDNLSLQIFHSVNFQNHINRMMMKDLENLASKRRRKRKGSDTDSEEQEEETWKKLQQTLANATKAEQKQSDPAAKKGNRKEDEASNEPSSQSSPDLASKTKQTPRDNSCKTDLRKRNAHSSKKEHRKKYDKNGMKIRRTESGTIDHSRRR